MAEEKKNISFSEEVVAGMTMALDAMKLDSRAKDAAMKFMSDNEIKLTANGKMFACGYIEDRFRNDPVQSAFWQMVIYSL